MVGVAGVTKANFFDGQPGRPGVQLFIEVDTFEISGGSAASGEFEGSSEGLPQAEEGQAKKDSGREFSHTDTK
jgi:hypothetical protein